MRDLSVMQADISTMSTKGLTIIGGVYNYFRGPLTSLTNLIASIPLSQGLKENLESAGIKWSPEEYLVIISTAATLVFVIVLMLFGSISGGLGDVSLLA